MQFDVSNVKDADQRKEAAALYEAMIRAEEARDAHVMTDAEEARGKDREERRRAAEEAHHKRIDAIYDKYEPQVSAIREQRDAEIKAANQEIEAELQAIETSLPDVGPYADLDKAFDAASAAYNDHPTPPVMTDDDDGVTLVRCALSGLPLLDGDELLEDSEGRKVLRCLVLPHLDVVTGQEEAA